MKWFRSILAVGLLGCVVLWVGSYWRISLVSSKGNQYLWMSHGMYIVSYFFDNALEDQPVFSALGYKDQSTDWWPIVHWGRMPDKFCYIYGTFWLPTLLLALALGVTFNPWSRRKRRAKQGLCIRCGYDLKGGEHERCPECGAEAAQKE